MPISNNHLFSATLFTFFCVLWVACSETPTPKPRAYPRITLPQHAYQNYQSPECPFSFDYPTYAKVVKDKPLTKNEPENPCWMNVQFADLNAEIFMSYKEMDNKKNSLAQLIKDAETLNSKHVRKADYMEDSIFVTDNGVLGIYYEVGGDAASPTQFFLTDSLQHFIWASLYFAETPNEDSIAPVLDFVREDIDRMLNSFKWK